MGARPWSVVVALASSLVASLAWAQPPIDSIPRRPPTVSLGVEDISPIGVSTDSAPRSTSTPYRTSSSPYRSVLPQDGELANANPTNYVVKIVDPVDGIPIDDNPDCGACCMQRCHPAPWEHTCSLFADFLYMRPRNADVAYGVPIDGPIIGPPPASPIQIGPTGIVDPDYAPAFRIGGSYDLNHPANIRAQWTHFTSDDSDSISTTAPNLIRSLVSHPSSQSAATNFLRASADTSIDYDLVDVDYRGPLACGKKYYLNYLLGARYANLDQDFNARFASLGTETVSTRINFDGLGIRIGAEGERYAPGTGFKLYGRGAASFVVGEFSGRYLQQQSFDPTVVNTSINVGRIVPMVDLEIGAGWASPSGHWHFTAGYLVSAWYNVVKTSDFIKGVQQNDVSNLSDTLTFDGLVARGEYRF